ncbi:hypothetical protein Aph01nite_42440 [Acrocarpospora phusangensis]|uniref:DUF2203 domain-containing protein n=1 Tax=Acrocarpospora phusangensis TaxID=1070424 RepID=A0A919QB66_9ACTN|nr:DUF2203 domain-containing protein [Acrocarpospora phusangensis]GIH25934.1 hypothetical protein Aph01nite_42440 [Acrocarpospora phusangensis]
MERIFSVEGARSLMPEARELVAELIELRADLAELGYDLKQSGTSARGGLAEAKGLEARLAEIIGWFADQGIELKGIAPVLIDFPAVRDGVSVRLCWIEGESELAWYHRSELGFAGRRPL